MALLLLKAGLGVFLFTLILWCAQSRHPRAAGMMLTFPALNGLGLLAGEPQDRLLMASAMLPMIAANGLLCTAYILAQRVLSRLAPPMRPRRQAFWLMGACLLLWFLMAAFLAPYVQARLISSGGLIVFALGYVLATAPLVVLSWCPAQAQMLARQRLWRVIRANVERIAALLVLIVLVMLCVRFGASAWAGRLSAFPLLPLYTLAMIATRDAMPERRVALLEQLGSMVLCGPVVAMLFVWGYGGYLSLLAPATHGLVYISGGVVGLLVGWGICGVMIWGGVRLATVVDES